VRALEQRPDWRGGVDVAIAVVLGGMAFADGLASTDFPRPGTGVAILMGAAGGSLVLRRVRPTTGLILSLGLMSLCALVFGPFQSGTSVLIAIVACFSAMAYGVRILVFAATVVVFAIADSLEPPLLKAFGDAAFIVTLLTIVGAGGYLARRLRATSAAESARRELAERESASRAQAAVDDERSRVTRELHDILSHSLGVVVLQTGAAEHAWDSDPTRARESVHAARSTALEAIDQLRTLLAVVRAGPDDDRSPVPSLAELSSLAARTTSAGFPVELSVLGVPRTVSPQVQASVYRVTQEGIANAMKHSGAHGCRIQLDYRPDTVTVRIDDEGSGAGAAPGSQLGLAGVRERAALFGGSVEAGPRETGGWRLEVGFPA
jgi:signal transduction histidine kinase